MGAQFCVALLRLKRLTGLRNHQHLLDLESDIIGTQSKVARLVLQKTQSHSTQFMRVHTGHLKKPHTIVEYSFIGNLIETRKQTKTTHIINLFFSAFYLKFFSFLLLSCSVLILTYPSQDIWGFESVFCYHKSTWKWSQPAFFFIDTNILITARHVPPRLWFSTVWLSLWLRSTTQETNEGLNLCRAAVSIIEILPMIMCDEYNENFGLRGKWSWIIVSSIIIS